MKNALAIIFIIVLSAFLYTLTLRGVSGNPDINTVKAEYEGTSNPLELSPERGRFAHVMSLGENGSYELGPILGKLAYPDVGYSDGKFYSFFAPGISYMATPFYLWGKQYGLAQVFTFGFVSIMSILALIFIFKVAREVFKLPLWASILAPVIFAFGSSAWSYSGTLYQHHPTVFFLISGFYWAWRYKQGGKFSWLWACLVWAGYALSIAIDYPNAVLMLPVMVYLLVSAFSITDSLDSIKINFRSSLIATFIIFAIITGAHLYHNKIHFGGWTKLSGELVSYKTLVERNLDPDAPETKIILQELGHKKSAIAFFSEFRIVRGFNTLMFASDRGLFVFAPIFILGILGLIYALKKEINMEFLTLLGIIIGNVFLYSSWGDPWGGWAYGPRYLILSMSILSIFTANFLVTGSRLLMKRMIALLLFLYSSAIGLLGAITTNAVPPSVEAVGLGVSSNYMFNVPFLENGQTSSFIYRIYLHNYLSLTDYFFYIFGLVALVFIYLVFVMPKFKHGN